MGMFDQIRCHAPLPDGFREDVLYQTKDTPEQFLEHYTITAEGRLVYHYVQREWVEEPDTFLGGHFAEVEGSREERVVDFHGDIRFYASNVCGSGPHGVMTRDDSPPVFREYTARFSNGRLEWIRGGVTPERYEGRPHLSRAEWHRRHEIGSEAEG